MAVEEVSKLNEKLSLSLDNTNRYIIFQLNGEILGLNVKYVREVVDLNEVRVIPKLSEKFKGICILRGEILPVLHLSKCIYGENFIQAVDTEQTGKRKIQKTIFIHGTDEVFGLSVDEIDDIIELTDAAFKYIPSVVQTRIPLQYIKNIAQIKENTVITIDFLKIMKNNFSLYDGYFLEEEDEEESLDSDTEFLQDENEQVKSSKKTKAESRSRRLLDLNSEQLDALKEIASIATGKIPEALTQLLVPGTKIDMNVLNVGLKDLVDFREMQALNEELYIGIRSVMKEDFKGVVYLLISLKELKTLMDKVELIEDFPENVQDIDDMDENTKSAIQEIGNIIISQYTSGLSNFLKLRMYHETPEISIGEYNTLIDSEFAKILTQSDKTIFSETAITINEDEIDATVLFIPYYESIDDFVSRLDADRIVDLLEQESKKSSKKKGKKTSKKKAKKSTKKGKKSSKKKTTKAKKKTSKPKNEIRDVIDNKSSKFMEKVIFQNDIEIDQEVLDELNITMANLDSFRELGNMGAGNAGNSLSQILKEKVYLEIPPAEALSISELVDSFGKKNRKMIVYMGSNGGLFQSNIFLMFTPTDMQNLLDHILDKGFKKTIKNESDLTATEKEAMIKLLEMLVENYFKAVAEFLKINFEPPVYKFFYILPKMLFEKLKRSSDDNLRAIVVETNMLVNTDFSMKGSFILLLGSDVIHNILERMKEVWIDE
jgi:chemotaxis protein CheY-P-specific phosphatase CheC/chemotaxis signal transduction protein